MLKLDIRDEVLWANQLLVPGELQYKFFAKSAEVIEELVKNSQATITLTRDRIENELQADFDELCEGIQNEPHEIEELGIDLRFTSESSTEKNSEDEIQAIYTFKPEE